MANNIVMKITDYIAHLWHDTDNDIVMAKNINGWENTLQQHAEFLKRFSWQPNTAYPKNSVLLYPFGLHTKLVSKNAGTSGNNEPTWSDASGQEGSRTITDNDIIWEEQPIQVSADTTPIGTIKQQLWNSAPPGYLKMTQSHVLNRSEYPELWNVVETRMPLTTEVEWQKMLTLNKTSVPFFSSGDESTTFRTPILLDDITASDSISFVKEEKTNIVGNSSSFAFNSFVAVGSSGTADTDLIITAISYDNTTINGYVSGVNVMHTAGRSKYGQGATSISFPVPKGASWSVSGGRTIYALKTKSISSIGTSTVIKSAKVGMPYYLRTLNL
jgi:hypothetical protein